MGIPKVVKQLEKGVNLGRFFKTYTTRMSGKRFKKRLEKQAIAQIINGLTILSTDGEWAYDGDTQEAQRFLSDCYGPPLIDDD